MKLNLTQALLEKNVLRPGTEIEAVYEAIDLSGVHRVACKGNFVIMAIKGTAEQPVFHIAAGDGKRRRITCEAIESVDGMVPPRLASIYNLKSDGTPRPVGKRRGRKPKPKVEAVVERDLVLADN